jgi:hypothetical protein
MALRAHKAQLPRRIERRVVPDRIHNNRHRAGAMDIRAIIRGGGIDIPMSADN